MAILVVGKCSANFGCQFLGKALVFPGKRLQKSLPGCFFTLDTDFDWLRQNNKPSMAFSSYKNIAHGRCSLFPLYCHIVKMTSLNRQDVLDLISQTDSASDDGMSSDEEEYLNLALGVVSGVSRQVF
jgi:hypothetical protein